MYLLGSHGLVEQRVQLGLGGGLGEGDAIVAKLGSKEGPGKEAPRVVGGLFLVALEPQAVGVEQGLEAGAVDSLVALRRDDAVPDGEAISFEDRFIRWRRRSCGHDGRTDE